MKRVIRVLLKIILGLFILIFLALLILPVFLKKPAMKKAETELNNMLNAELGFDDVKLSFIRNFPRLSVGLEGLTVMGVDEFEGRKLVGFKSFRIIVNLASLLSKEGVEIRSVIIDTPEINALILENGLANYDIMKESEQDTEDPEEEAEGPDIKLRLNKFSIINAKIIYTDHSSNIKASLEDFDFSMSGKLGTSHTEIRLQADAGPVNVVMDHIPYLKDVNLNVDMGLAADLDNMKFSLIDNEFALNDLVLQLEGDIDLGGEDPEMDISFNSLNTAFKSLISLVPAIYMNDFQELETSGSLKLAGSVKGFYIEKDSIYPDVIMKLEVEDAMFKYPDLPTAVENINISLKLDVDGEDMDRTKFDLDNFSFTVEGNPVVAELHLKTPLSDPWIKAGIEGDMDIGALSAAIPVEGIDMRGNLSSGFSLEARLSSIENEAYQDIDAAGSIELNAFKLDMQELPVSLEISGARLDFDPGMLELSQLDMMMGESDIHLKGKLDNYLLYTLKDEDLQGAFVFSSSNLNINELMPEMADEEELAEDDTLSMSLIEIPANVDFSFSSELSHVEYDNLIIDDLQGEILIKDSKLILDRLFMKILDGSMLVNAMYLVSDSLVPEVNMDLSVKDIDIASAFKSFNSVQALAPFAKDLKGEVSASLKYSGELDKTMMPDISTIDGSGRLSSREISIVSAPVFDKMKELLKSDKAISNTMKDINISFRIIDGRVIVTPFDFKMANVPASLSGSHGLDQSLDYKLEMNIPRETLGSGANALIDQLGSGAASLGLAYDPEAPIAVNFLIGGVIGNPELSMGAGESSKDIVKKQVEQEVTKKIEETKQEIQKKVEETKQEAREELNKEIEKIMADAEREAENIRKSARDVAEQVKKEAEANAVKIEKEAEGRGSIAKSIANKAADKLREEGDRKARQIVNEADAKAEQLLREAREEADKLK